jgi:hypothetical protein
MAPIATVGLQLRVGALAVAILLVVGPWSAAAPAGAAVRPYVSEFTFSPHVGPPGASITIDGTCLWGGAPVGGGFVYLASPGEWGVTIGAKLPTDSKGHVTGAIGVPADAPAGVYLLAFDCWYDDVAFGPHDYQFVVTPGPAGSSTTTTESPTTTTTTSTPAATSTSTTTTASTSSVPVTAPPVSVSGAVRSAPAPAQPATPVVVAAVELTG